MNRIEAKFVNLKKNKKKAFIAFITAGYPSLDVTYKLILEFSRIGVDAIELGVPFSDPIADGPIIQEASGFALKRNVHLAEIFNLVKKARLKTQVPICLMTYYNPVFCFNEAKFVERCVSSGVDGVIIPDLPPEEGKALIKLANNANLDIICFVSPTTSSSRMKLVSRISRGFIYYVSLTGVTGARKSLPDDLVDNLKAIKRITKKPVCVGFGVSTAAQVKEVSKYADGVIVGSAIVRGIKERIGKSDLVKKVSALVVSLKG
ncbi:MAG: tryptophan synthase subunit alpha [Candidatus Omnitrophica bacterium]|nr:tryptophan synthase subunit alpha [Candidatus Omnitrophota bacterium]